MQVSSSLLLMLTSAIHFTRPPQRQLTPEQQAAVQAQQAATREEHQRTNCSALQD
jgi:hypothetical protein